MIVPVTPVMFKVDVTVGVPEAEIFTGTFELVKLVQFAVVKEKVEEAGDVPQPEIATTLQ